MVLSVEAGTTKRRRATIDVIRRALTSAGIEFIDENGGGVCASANGKGLV